MADTASPLDRAKANATVSACMGCECSWACTRGAASSKCAFVHLWKACEVYTRKRMTYKHLVTIFEQLLNEQSSLQTSCSPLLLCSNDRKDFTAHWSA